MAPDLRLGLIGDNIAASSAPRLHRLAGEHAGKTVTYDLLVPRERGETFEEVFAACARAGYRGLNITYPYKERVTALLRIEDPLVRAIGAVNTVLFEADGAHGFNTDHSGFIAAWRGRFAQRSPGRIAIIGAGGVGRAIAFGLVALGAEAIALVDTDDARARALADALSAVPGGPRPLVSSGIGDLPWTPDGLINATPVGMVGKPGSPVPACAFRGVAWVFDAVYTPVDTLFLADAAAMGARILSGYELFFEQGVDAWRLFSGGPPDRERLRRDLAA